MSDTIEQRFRRIAPDVDFCSLRFVDERHEFLQVRQNVLQPVQASVDRGAMITVIHGGGLGYAATTDLTESGLAQAARQARDWAKKTAKKSVVDFAGVEVPKAPRGKYLSPVENPWTGLSLTDKVAMLKRENERLKIDDRIVDWEATLWYSEVESLYLTADGGRVEQKFHYIAPSLSATANEGVETQNRSLGGRGYCRQGGLEVLDHIGFHDAAPTVAQEALELLDAPNCPSGAMDVLLAPDQMILQIHESIGHPLELDRILGDERNYAGTSFVTLDMFGSYQYGSKLLNITYDPTNKRQFASYGFDDEGLKAKKQFIIRKGILERPLGGVVSQQRAGMEGVANSRASSWNRPPIDRMANLNLELGKSSFEEMVASVEKGVYMKTNNSWSIDDSRNKFQFGCEWGQLIEDGKLTKVVKKPNYRGISATFWRNLKMVGNESTYDVLGTPYCGKGEPNQVVRVGHASPTCLFADVDVFGGE
jgi:predicted Zn-dependent protease